LQRRHRLVLLGGHQVAIGADETGLLADDAIMVVRANAGPLKATTAAPVDTSAAAKTVPVGFRLRITGFRPAFQSPVSA
jgi:hypothetical protein